MQSTRASFGSFIYRFAGVHFPRNAKLLIALFAIFQFACSSTGQPSQFDWKPIADAIGKPRANSAVRMLLHKLRRAGDIVKSADGRYAIG